ncbi:MAG: PaaI family thioesterase [Bacteroidales bacterium]|nr:PaaI family thioesterase [Bacteroidales bacterium]
MTNLTLKAREVFANDRYATEATNVVIDWVEAHAAQCSIALAPIHRNALGAVMGGVMFTLADLAFAASANSDRLAEDAQLAWVSLSSSIQYLSQPKGNTLVAKSTCVKQGRTTCVYNINITDENNNLAAIITTTGMRIN